MNHLNNFISEFRDGFQPNNRFKCQLFVPPGLLQAVITSNIFVEVIDILFPNIGRRIDNNFSAPQAGSWLARGLVCESTSLPSRSFEEISQTMYGLSEKYPVHTTYLNHSCTFLLPLLQNDNPIVRFFNFWQNFVQNAFNGPESGLNFQFPDTYRGQMYLTMYDKQDHATVTYFFDRVYPQTVDASNLSWDSTNEVLRLPVSFTFSYWKMLPFQAPPLVEIDLNL
jgi:hypothetical protein